MGRGSRYLLIGLPVSDYGPMRDEPGQRAFQRDGWQVSHPSKPIAAPPIRRCLLRKPILVRFSLEFTDPLLSQNW
jgi:hypothetical protein